MNKKKLIQYLVLTFFVVALVIGCGKSAEIEDVSGDGKEAGVSNVQEKETEKAQETTEEAISTISLGAIEEKSNQPIKQPQNITQAEEEKEVASVIVKSENNLSDTEKKQIVDQLSQEVDDLLTEINAEE